MNTWSCAARDRFLMRSWSGEEAVAFDTSSGDTHLLEPLALELLQRLDPVTRRSAQALLDDLSDLADDTTSESALDAIERSLDAMRRVGLVVAYPT